MIIEDGAPRELDYETDILASIDWRGFDPTPTAAKMPDNARAAERQLQRITLFDEGDELFVGEMVTPKSETSVFDLAHSVRMVSDLLSNPFVAREVVGQLLDAPRGRGFDASKLGRFANLISAELRRGLDSARTARAEELSKVEVAAGRIQFRSRLDGRNWRTTAIMEKTEPADARRLLSKTGGPLEKSLFEPAYESELNKDERDGSVYLDGEGTLSWWHRNVARSQYGIQG